MHGQQNIKDVMLTQYVVTGEQQFEYKYRRFPPNKPSILGWYKHLLVTVMAIK
jgi:hypothetical protein